MVIQGMMDDTIAAISTPPGYGAIGIVRLSGPKALDIAARLFVGERKIEDLPGFSAARGWVEHRGERIDEVLCLVMRAPKSYTRQDVVEFQCHGGPVLLGRVLEAVLAEGARLAGPGEFTRRAFLSGRIDLAQAEAVADLVWSETAAAARSAAAQLDGALSRQVQKIHDSLLELLALTEANIDFSDQDLQAVSCEEIKANLKALMMKIEGLLKDSGRGRLLREGLKVAIAGRPNVGKSTLMNALLKSNRVIVTPYPGTTRDVVEEVADILGLPVHLSDTAGIHDTENPIEQEGIARARQTMDNADLVLLVLDTSEPLQREDLELMKSLSDRLVIVVLNKSDLKPAWNERHLSETLIKKHVKVSALHGTGLEDLERAIAEYVTRGHVKASIPAILTNVRHRDALRKAQSFLEAARASAEKGLSEEFIALDLREALTALAEIPGENVSEAVLEQIFSRFCIGK